jgi:hypothetical protein
VHRVSGIYRSGKVELEQSVDWPNGTQVDVLCEQAYSDTQDMTVGGSAWQDTPQARKAWLEWFNTLEPVLEGPELQAFEDSLKQAREEQRKLLPKWLEQTDNIHK